MWCTRLLSSTISSLFVVGRPSLARLEVEWVGGPERCQWFLHYGTTDGLEDGDDSGWKASQVARPGTISRFCHLQPG
jgi:hypothetical protein